MKTYKLRMEKSFQLCSFHKKKTQRAAMNYLHVPLLLLWLSFSKATQQLFCRSAVVFFYHNPDKVVSPSAAGSFKENVCQW